MTSIPNESANREVLEEVLELPSPWPMHHGGVLERARIAYRIEGPPGAPLVAAIGGISGHRTVCAGEPGAWWSALVGDGLGLDRRRHRILGIDYLGGSGESSAPVPGDSFPSVSAYDQADALAEILKRRDLGALHAILGASYGGQVALAFGARHPGRVGRLVVVSAADQPQPLATARRCVQRQIVREALARGDGPAGLKLARALAMTTYRSAREFEERFGGPPTFEHGRFVFPVERYLFARGDDYVRRYRAESFLALSESIDLFQIDPATVRVPATLIAVHEDQLVPIADLRALAARLGGPCRLVAVNSLYGHDAFLKESEMLNPIVAAALADGVAT